MIGALRRYADAGVTDLCIRFIGDDQLGQLERFTRDFSTREKLTRCAQPE